MKIVVTIPNQVGALLNILRPFLMKGTDILELTSRAIRERDGEHAFCITVRGTAIEDVVVMRNFLKHSIDYRVVTDFPDSVTTNNEGVILSL